MSKLLFQTRTGSRAYGLELENSDYDVLRVVVNDADNYLGLTPYKESSQFRNSGEDVVDYDVRFYAKLVANGNPNALLPLFFDKKNCLYVADAFESFISHRRSYLGPRMISSFAGMAFQSWKTFLNALESDTVGPASWKKAANALYTLGALKHLGMCGCLAFDNAELMWLRHVKKGNVDAAEVVAAFETLERKTSKEVLGFYRILKTQESVLESLNTEVTKAVRVCLSL